MNKILITLILFFSFNTQIFKSKIQARTAILVDFHSDEIMSDQMLKFIQLQ